MMMHKDTVPRPKVGYASANRDHFSGWLVAEHQGRLFLHVPAHDIARTDATDPGFDQGFTRTNLWDWLFFKADVGGIVETSNSHAVI
jgi:hypothetical protein